MSISESVMIILAAVSILGSIAVAIVSWRTSRLEALKKHVAEFLAAPRMTSTSEPSLGSRLMAIASRLISRSKTSKMYTAGFFDRGVVINALRASMNDKYSKKQTEVVARIVWRYYAIPLTTILKVPEERYNIHRGLSYPNQYPWDTKESEHIK